jgi:DNA helicase IV
MIVRSDLSKSVCVQGAQGTGKTAVGLHRVAYLLYAHREQLSRRGVLVVGPNASFLRYIRDVLPALGEIDAKQTTIVELVADTLARLQSRTGIRGEDTAAVATLKGDARMAAVLERALWSHVATPTEGLVVPRGARRWRVATYEIDEVIAALRHRGVRYGAARTMLPQSLAHRILVKMELAGDAPDDRVQDSVARSKPVKDYVNAIWPAVDPRRLLWRLLSDPPFLAAAADGILDPAQQMTLLWPRPPRSPGVARWSLADAVLLDEAADLVQRTPSLAHIVADEAQDLSPMMLRALARRSSTGSLTVLGDLAQATTPWATRSWAEALGHLGRPDAHIEELTRGFRVPADVIEYAARLLPHIAPGLTPPTSVRRARGDLSVLTATGPLADAVLAQVHAVMEREGSIALIAPDTLVPALGAGLTTAGRRFALLGAQESAENEFEQHLDLVPATLAKGLEFDHVVLAEPAAIVGAEPDRVTGLRRLYVCLTRAVTSLVVIHQAPLPDELAG